ncbi:MAG: glutathione ABC transporter substrate-binding protein [Calditrichia bacterium]
MNRKGFLLGIILFAAVLAGCGSDNSSRNILRVALFDNPTNLDPRTYSDVASYRVIEQIYDSLIKLDSTGTPQPFLAESWKFTADTLLEFKIRRGVRFHDGVPLTAHDVAFTFRSVMDPALNAPSRKSFEVIRAITVPDSYRVVFHLKQVYAPILSNLEMGIVPKHLAEKDPKILQRQPVGSGPFKFVRWKTDAFVELRKNADYWSGPAKIDGILIKILPEATTRVLALENDEIDFLMNEFPENYLERFRKNPKLKIQMKSGSNYVYLGLNLRNRYLSVKKVRQAIAHAIDVKGIIRNLHGGIYQPARSLLHPRHWAYQPGLPEYQYDPSLAKRLLEEAGFPDPDGDGPHARFRLVYKCTDKQKSRQKAQVIQSYLKAVGIDLEIQSYEWGTFFDDIQNGRFDMYSLTWVGVYEPDLYYRLFHSENIGVGANRGAFKNPEVDRLIEAAQGTLDQQKRKALYGQIQKILAEELPYISLWYETNIAVMQKRVVGFELYPAAEWFSFRNVHLENISD